MHRFYAPIENIQKDVITLEKNELHHLRSVMRLKEGNNVFVFDGEGMEYACVISSINAQRATLAIQSKVEKGLPFPEIILLQAIPKLDRMDTVVQKAVEIGARVIIPLITKRTIIHLNESKMRHKIQRWQKIAIESTKQCGRADLLKIYEPVDFTHVFNHELIKENPDALNIIGYLGDNTTPLKQCLSSVNNNTSQYRIFIGPEGDFTKQEIDHACAHGCTAVRFGPRVLRTDTASIFLMSAIMYELGK